MVYQHTRQMALVACDIATELGLPPPIVYKIGKAAILHDMGKLDEDIKALIATSRLLTQDERILVHRHVRLSAQRAPSDPVIRFAICSHHEYNRRDPYDRCTPPATYTGPDRRANPGYYPVISGQILAVADILQSLAAPFAERSYRPVEELSASDITEILRADFTGLPSLVDLAVKRLVS